MLKNMIRTQEGLKMAVRNTNMSPVQLSTFIKKHTSVQLSTEDFGKVLATTKKVVHA